VAMRKPVLAADENFPEWPLFHARRGLLLPRSSLIAAFDAFLAMSNARLPAAVNRSATRGRQRVLKKSGRSSCRPPPSLADALFEPGFARSQARSP